MKNNKNREQEPPVWLVNLLIRARVWRWRVNDRLKRWAGEFPGRVRSFILTSLLVGGMLYLMIFIQSFHRKYFSHGWPTERIAPQGSKLPNPPQRNSASADPDAAHFWRLTDSIRSDTSLRRAFDSLLHARPAFSDSLRQVEEMLPPQSR